MSSKYMWADLGFNAINTVTNFMAASNAAKMERAMRAHKEKMAAISAQMQLDTMNSNRIRAAENKQLADFELAQVAQKRLAEAKVSAAAAGVAGASVQSSLQDVRRQAAGARVKLDKSYQDTQRELQRAERDVKMNAIYGRDTSVTTNPSLLGTFAGGFNNLLNVWDEHQPEGRRSTDLR